MEDGKITITKRTSNIEQDYIFIHIEKDRKNVAKVKLSLEDFARAITGQGFVGCSIDARARQYY